MANNIRWGGGSDVGKKGKMGLNQIVIYIHPFPDSQTIFLFDPPLLKKKKILGIKIIEEAFSPAKLHLCMYVLKAFAERSGTCYIRSLQTHT